jgi:F-type H+-transporting ATPase subunit b
MQIDWFTLVAQIVNFLILAVLLWYFLFRRIIRAMDERERAISARFEDADRRESQAQRQAEEYQRKMDEIGKERETLLQQAKEEVQRRRDELMEQARSDAERQREQWQMSLESQKQAFAAELKRRILDEVRVLTGYIAKELFDSDARRRMTEVFLDRLKKAGKADIEALRDAAENAGRRIELQAGYDLTKEDRRNIEDVVHEVLGRNLEIHYADGKKDDIGVTIRANGQKIEWGVKRYLEDVSRNIESLFNEQAATRRGGAGRERKEQASESP